MRLGDYSERIEAGQAYSAAFAAARQAYGERMRARYPQAEAAWSAAVATRPPAAHGGVDLVGELPWLPFDEPIKLADGTPTRATLLQQLTAQAGVDVAQPYFFPSPGPGNFNFGGHAQFGSTGVGFAGANWRDLVRNAGGNPDAPYLSAFVQSPLAGAGKYDYVEALYMRAGEFWRPIAAYGKGRTSSWVSFRDDALKPSLMVAAAFGGASWLASQIGSGLVGSTFAAANPGVTSAIGQTVLQTAINGGDLGEAIKSVALGQVGGLVGAQAGSLASTLTDSQLLADVANAAVATAVQGGDVETAVARTLVRTGADSLSSLFAPSPEVTPMDYFDPVYDAPIELPQLPAADYFDPVYDAPVDLQVQVADIGQGSWSGTDWTTTPDFNAWTDWNFNPNGLDLPAQVQQPAPAQTSSGSSWDGAIVTLTNAAMAAIKINAAYQASQQPQLRTSTVSGQTVSTPNANGTLTVRNTQTGQVATTRPQAGVPYTLPDGRTVINNGNGTYSLIGRDGSSSTKAYGTSGVQAGVGAGVLDSLRSVPPVAWAIGAGLVVAALRSR